MVPELTALHQSQAKKNDRALLLNIYSLVTPLGLGSLEKKGLKSVGYVL